jgi:hypothetical protein
MTTTCIPTDWDELENIDPQSLFEDDLIEYFVQIKRILSRRMATLTDEENKKEGTEALAWLRAE